MLFEMKSLNGHTLINNILVVKTNKKVHNGWNIFSNISARYVTIIFVATLASMKNFITLRMTFHSISIIIS